MWDSKHWPHTQLMGKCPPSEENCLHPHSGDMELGNLKLLGVLFGAGGPRAFPTPRTVVGMAVVSKEKKRRREEGQQEEAVSFYFFDEFV